MVTTVFRKVNPVECSEGNDNGGIFIHIRHTREKRK
jgi:hypothetical protein